MHYRQQNRIHARKSRLRRKRAEASLAQELADLRTEIGVVQAALAALGVPPDTLTVAHAHMQARGTRTPSSAAMAGTPATRSMPAPASRDSALAMPRLGSAACPPHFSDDLASDTRVAHHGSGLKRRRQGGGAVGSPDDLASSSLRQPSSSLRQPSNPKSTGRDTTSSHITSDPSTHVSVSGAGPWGFPSHMATAVPAQYMTAMPSAVNPSAAWAAAHPSVMLQYPGGPVHPYMQAQAMPSPWGMPAQFPSPPQMPSGSTGAPMMPMWSTSHLPGPAAIAGVARPSMPAMPGPSPYPGMMPAPTAMHGAMAPAGLQAVPSMPGGHMASYGGAAEPPMHGWLTVPSSVGPDIQPGVPVPGQPTYMPSHDVPSSRS